MAVRLGDVEFTPAPRRAVPFGGTQSLVRQEIPGAGPHYQDMGPEENIYSLEGTLDGDDALQKALKLDQMRRSGGVYTLITDLLPPVQVRIREFRPQVLRATRVEYSIELVEEGVQPDWRPPTPPPDATTPTASPASQTYTVVAGDTLWAIAQRFMGNGARWPALAAKNGITDPTALQVGQVLQVPTSAEAATLAASYQQTTERRNNLLAGVPKRAGTVWVNPA